MGYWVFMLVMVLLVPLSMLLLGRRFMKTAPGKINYAFGYRTKRSMQNEETWAFAHHYFGRLWYLCGLVTTPVSVLVMLLTLWKGENAVSTAGSVLCIVQLIPVIACIFPTEHALKRTFDADGKRRTTE